MTPGRGFGGRVERRLLAARWYLLVPSLKCGDALFERPNASACLSERSQVRAT